MIVWVMVKMTSRERIRAAINHEPPDRLPIDLGATRTTGISVFSYNMPKEHLGIETGSSKITDVYQMLAEVELEVIDRLHVDVVMAPKLSHRLNARLSGWVKRRLPNSLNELLPGILFAIPMFFMCLTMPRWLGWFRDSADRRRSPAENGSKQESKTSSSDFGKILKWFSVVVLIIILLLAVSLIVPELQQRYMNSKLRFGPVVERKFYHSDANKPEIVFWDLDRDVIMTPSFAVALPEGEQIFKWLSPASLQNHVQLNQWVKDCGIDLALTFSKRQDSNNWSWYRP